VILVEPFVDGDLLPTTQVGDVFINSMDKANAGMDWDRAAYLLNASSTATTLVIMSTTKGRSGLAVTDFHLFNVTGLPNGGMPPPATIHPRPHAIDADPASSADVAAAPVGPAATTTRRRGGHGVGVLLALLSVACIFGLGAVMWVGGRAAGLSGGSPLASSYWSLPTFWRRNEEGYGVLGHNGIGGHGVYHQSPYQGSQGGDAAAAAVELSVARGAWTNGTAVSDGGDDSDDEVMFTRRTQGQEEGESKREGVVANGGGRRGGGSGGGGGKRGGKGKGGRKKEGV
jgi:hypothetical protein